ncbi:MAG: hypothetical protein ACQKBV_13610 [Puniceicoccales bacterium]
MKKEAIEKLLAAQPFQPFCFIMPKGEKVCVDNPELAEVPRKGNNLVVWEGETSAYSVVSLPHVNRIEPRAV